MSGFPEPKLIEESKYDSVCALCANEIPIGSPLWWFNKNCYCMEHSKAEIRTEAVSNEAQQTSPSHPTPTLPSTLTIRFDVEQWRDIDHIVQAIDNMTEVLKGMRKDNNERR